MDHCFLESTYMDKDVEIIAAHAEEVLKIASGRLSDEYYYQSLPLCIIDAVYSIGVRYEGVKNAVARYCAHFDLRRIRETRSALPPVHEQESVTAFCVMAERIGPASMANDVFRNRQRTSAKNGILKAEAVYRFAVVLREHGIEHLQDIPNVIGSTGLAADISSVHGQASGISLGYFFMLAGSDDLIKPDRMILAFLKSALDRSVRMSEAQELLKAAAELLSKAKYPHLTPRLLDHLIWNYQRDQ